MIPLAKLLPICKALLGIGATIANANCGMAFDPHGQQVFVPFANGQPAPPYARNMADNYDPNWQPVPAPVCGGGQIIEADFTTVDGSGNQIWYPKDGSFGKIREGVIDASVTYVEPATPAAPVAPVAPVDAPDPIAPPPEIVNLPAPNVPAPNVPEVSVDPNSVEYLVPDITLNVIENTQPAVERYVSQPQTKPDAGISTGMILGLGLLALLFLGGKE